MDEIAKRDENYVPVKLASNSTDKQKVIQLRVDPATGAVLVKSMGAPNPVAIQLPPQRDRNHVETMGFKDVNGSKLDSTNNTSVFSARCSQEGYLLIKSL